MIPIKTSRKMRGGRRSARRVRLLLGCILLYGMAVCRPGFAAEPASEQEIVETPVTEDDREHWSLSPLGRPSLPTVQNAGWAQQPLDFFVLRQLEDAGLEPAPQASRRQLLRRVKFDLLGLPPTPEEIATFEKDPRPGAYERLVDRLLASPAYGERWAQFWLDLARFAETDGFEHDKVRQGAWRYRDWVLAALNADMPYDEFLRRQLREDPDDASSQVATMFCMAGPDMPDINEQDLRRHDKLNELTSTVGSVVLGLQFHCAQCHDHKYDPISQADFYRLRAIFEPAVPLMKRDQPVLALRAQQDPQPARFYYRGELRNAGAVVPAGFPRVAVAEHQPYLCQTENPREEFCDWLFTKANPLTARVIANRVWQHHFGKSLPENPSDFGMVAGEPSHPDLLDWLACDLQTGQWSLKNLHRSILLSATYRQAGDNLLDEEYQARLQELDPDNALYSRFPRKRLEGELIRDAMLAVSGRLDRTLGGESVMPPLPPELVGTLLKGQWKTSRQEADWMRRSVYTFARRNLRYPVFDVFDRPDAGASCAMRNQSTTAIQSLHMLNSELTMQCAQALRDRLLADASPSAERLVDRLFHITLGRPASGQEQQWFGDHLNAVSAGDTKRLPEALLTACVAVFNSNEFLYVD